MHRKAIHCKGLAPPDCNRRMPVVTLWAAAVLALQPLPSAAQMTSPRGAVPNFAEATRSFCTRRHAEAYGRFVALADGGDVRAGRMALALYRLGPTVYGSQWDASTEQLGTWALWSQAADVERFATPAAAPAMVLSRLCDSAASTASVSSRHADPGSRRRRARRA